MRVVSVYACALMVIACSEQEFPVPNRVSAAIAGPKVEPAGFHVLDEPDSLPIGRPTALALGTNGDVFIADGVHRRILQFDKDGKLLRVLGRHGGGPGEFESVDRLTLVSGGSALLVDDFSRHVYSVFSADSGTFLRSSGYLWVGSGKSWTERGDEVWFGLTGVQGAFARWRWRTDSMTSYGRPPETIRRSPGLLNRYNGNEAMPIVAGVVAAFSGHHVLHLFDTTGYWQRGVILPNSRRKGTPELLDRAQAALGSGANGWAGSHVFGMWPHPSGNVALAHLDWDIAGRAGAFRYTNFRLYLSLVKSDLTSACVDAVIPVVTDVQPRPLLRHDTLFVFTQHVMENDKVETGIRGFRITDEGCEWLATEKVSMRP